MIPNCRDILTSLTLLLALTGCENGPKAAAKPAASQKAHPLASVAATARLRQPPKAASTTKPVGSASTDNAVAAQDTAANSRSKPASSASNDNVIASEDQVQVIAQGYQGCSLLGADDDAIYLSPSMLGSKKVIKLAMDGSSETIRFDERIMMHRYVNGFVYGCAGKHLGRHNDKPCRVAAASLADGKVKVLSSRKGVVFGGIYTNGKQLWTVEHIAQTPEKPQQIKVWFDAQNGEDVRALDLEHPSRLALSGDVLFAATGLSRRRGKLQRIAADGTTKTLVQNTLVGHPSADDNWVYYLDSRYHLMRVPATGGTPQKLLEQPLDRTAKLVNTPSYLIWLHAKLGDGEPLRIIKRMNKPRP